MIIDSAEWELRNPKALSFSERAITLRDAEFNVPTNYDVPIKNIGSVPLTIDSITLSGSISDFIIDTTYKKTILPNQISYINIQFLHNTAGDVECTFIIHTNLKQVLPGINDSIANPTFLLKGKVNKGNLVINRDGCNVYYLNAIKDTCQCKNVLTFLNNGQVRITVDSITFIGDSADFVFDPSDLKARRILEPNQTFKLQVIPKPQSNNARNYVGKIKVYSNNRDILNPIDVSYQSVLPGIFIKSPSSFILDADTTISIPIQFSRLNFPPGIDYRILRYFKLGLPLESRHAIYNASFKIDDEITLRDKFIVTDKLAASPNHNSERFFEIQNNEIDGFIGDTLGFLTFHYFLSEHDSINILINDLTITYPINSPGIPCYNSFSITNFPISIQKRKDICLDPFNNFFGDFLDNIRKSTNDFIASMKVSGEPVMEIQHFFKETTFAQISLYSVNGMKLETVFSGMAPAELHQFRHPMSHLPPGVYFCEMVAGQFRKTIPIILNR
ncbi:MAG: hypothetical protein ACK5F4_07735 [Ignavibacteria bacterium]